MKTNIFIALICLSMISHAVAAEFFPTLLTISSNELIDYDFDGTDLEIPVEVIGTPAGIIFCLFARDQAPFIDEVRNGYLGWHYVNKIDTCIYYSGLHNAEPGLTYISWDGNDQDGGIVPIGEYLYHLWAFDNQSDRQLAARPISPVNGEFMVKEVDNEGMPMSHPVYYTPSKRWYFGTDPTDETLVETCDTIPDGSMIIKGNTFIDPMDEDFFFARLTDPENETFALAKYRWVPYGQAELLTDWGEDGYSETITALPGGEPGVIGDGDYLYTADSNVDSSDLPDSRFFIFVFNGELAEEIDLSPWWSSESSYKAGGQMNGGPTSMALRGDIVFLNSHSSCLKQMIEPYRYIDAWDDMILWSNGNGDYVMDKNFDDTSPRPWVCNDIEAGTIAYNVAADDNLFSLYRASDAGSVSFGLMAPDGTGLGYFAYSGESEGWKRGCFVVDSDTPYDGLYFDYGHGEKELEISKENVNNNLTRKEVSSTEGTYFIAHDSFQGIITSMADWFGPHLVLQYPNGGHTWIGGTQQRIVWFSDYVGYITIEFTQDGGVSWDTIASHVFEGEYSYDWTVPHINSSTCKIRITAENDSIYTDTSIEYFTIQSDTGIEEEMLMPILLSANYPNPFNPSTTIQYTIPADVNDHVSLKIYDLRGAVVKTLIEQVDRPGIYSAVWNGRDESGNQVSSGIYIYQLKAGEFVKSNKMMLMK